MNIKIRHPWQVVDTSALIVGDKYYIISQAKGVRVVEALINTFGGVFVNSQLTAFVRGYNLDGMKSSEPKRNVFLDPPLADENDVFTIHNDGWRCSDSVHNKPTVIYWYGHRIGWDSLSIFLNEYTYRLDCHYMIVPQKHWEDDPKFHVLDWENPVGVVESKWSKKREKVLTVADWEQKINDKRDEGLRAIFGG